MFYNSHYSFVRFKDVTDFKELPLDYMHKKMNDFHKKFNRFKKMSSQRKTNEDLKQGVLDNTGDLFSELYYIYKEIYKEEKNSLNTKKHREL